MQKVFVINLIFVHLFMLMENNAFTKEEWLACIKVLSALKDNPFDNPDNETFASLIQKVSKNAKKINRKSSYSEKKHADLNIRLGTTLAKEALAGKNRYAEKEISEQTLHLLKIPINCYCCNGSFNEVHSFYNRLCPKCADENYKRRFHSVDLKGRNVILTGGRVKVGYATALKCLRSGANLVLTSRFPAMVLEQLKVEDDYETWKDRLWIYGLDLRNLSAIKDFIDYYKLHFETLDILINNAAQTIKYPDEYYLPLVKQELKFISDNKSITTLSVNKTSVLEDMKQLEIGDINYTDLPLNRFGQPVDSREKTSWNSLLEEVSVYELLEVNFINHIAPYFLIKELKPLLERSVFKEKFIINVSSSEGIFSYENKTVFHPHTNMTKAALNMLTLTSASAFAAQNIFMTAVDVGWISTGAKETLRKKQFEEGYIPPLDSVDGAARIFHPIIESINGNHIFGKLLKNYKIHSW